MGFSRQEYWSDLPSLLQWTTFCQTSPPWPIHLGWSHTAWLWVRQAVVSVIRLASCLWLWFQSVCPLMPSLSAYHITWVSLTLDVEYLFMAAPAKHSHRPWPWTWGSFSWPVPALCRLGQRVKTNIVLLGIARLPFIELITLLHSHQQCRNTCFPVASTVDCIVKL